MHDQQQLLENRLTRFVAEHLRPALYRRRQPVELTWWVAPGEPVPFAEAVRQEFAPVEIGTDWGRPWGTAWIHVTGAVPTDWLVGGNLPPGTAAELIVDLGFSGGPGFQAEALAWSRDGVTIKAVAPFNHHVPLDPHAPVDLYLEAASNPDIGSVTFAPTAMGDPETAGDDPINELRQIEIGLLDQSVWELLQDIATLDGLMRELPESTPRRFQILHALSAMLDVIDPADIAGTAPAARAELSEMLSRPANASAHRIVAVGHAHIDSAWLWPVRETIRKCARTFSNVLQLAEADPEFRFACSSAQQYAWIEEHYPELFERITKAVANGQFIPVGGMWVEADTNMPGGEAMARQFVAGKRYFLDRFGIDTAEVWLPDSFGYSAALPQIVRASGSQFFLTQKISWNQTNAMPHHTFWWEGIDGTRVLTHFPPVDTYNSDLSARDLARAERQYREKGLANTSLVPFGYGDGGGGPTREMMAAAHRTRSLEGSPTVRIDSPQAFFEEAAAEYANPPVWNGEMYLELHRGTYTTQAATKQGNRRSEHLLREAELWAATAAVRVGYDYPYAELDALWKLVLLQQFHDILPGSSIAWVHHDAERNYAAIAERAEAAIGAAVRALVGSGDRRLLLNAAPHPRDGVAALAIAEAEPTAEPVRIDLDDSDVILDNGLVRVVVDQAGHITSLVDAATGREAIAPGAVGNLLQLHRDIPNQWDAWDVDEHYRRVVSELDGAESVEIEGSDDAAAVVIRRTFGASTIEQQIVLRAGSPSVEIVNDIDWHEQQKLLKLGFGLDVHADRSASETQFGHVYRPTHRNTSWEFARFEICAHRWIHVGEPGYGVAISNDSTYGHDVGRTVRAGGGTTTTVRLSLLRGPLFPDPEADQGQHVLRVTIRPGAGIGDAVEEGYRTNLPTRTVAGARDVAPLLSIGDPTVVVEAVKLAEDGSGDVVVRLYESRGGRASTEVTPGFDVSEITCVDLLERPVDGAGTLAGRTLTLRPFQLVSLRFVRGV